jgi:hypothetical protein
VAKDGVPVGLRGAPAGRRPHPPPASYLSGSPSNSWPRPAVAICMSCLRLLRPATPSCSPPSTYSGRVPELPCHGSADTPWSATCRHHRRSPSSSRERLAQPPLHHAGGPSPWRVRTWRHPLQQARLRARQRRPQHPQRRAKSLTPPSLVANTGGLARRPDARSAPTEAVQDARSALMVVLLRRC